MCLIMCLWYNRLEFYLSILKAILWAWWAFCFFTPCFGKDFKVFFHCNFKWFSISNSFYLNFWCFGAEMGWGWVNGLESNSVHTCRPLHVVTSRSLPVTVYQFGAIKCSFSFWILFDLYHPLEFVSGLLVFFSVLKKEHAFLCYCSFITQCPRI